MIKIHLTVLPLLIAGIAAAGPVTTLQVGIASGVNCVLRDVSVAQGQTSAVRIEDCTLGGQDLGFAGSAFADAKPFSVSVYGLAGLPIGPPTPFIISLKAEYSGQLLATGGTGPVWLDFQLSAGGSNVEQSWFQANGQPREDLDFFRLTYHTRILTSFGAPMDYTIETEDVFDFPEAAQGRLNMSVTAVNASGVPIPGAQVLLAPEPGGMALLGGPALVAILLTLRRRLQHARR